MKHFCLLILSLLMAGAALATHNRAGEITYRQTGNLTYEATITTYTKMGVPADRDTLTLNWGDGTSSKLPRVVEQDIGNNIKMNKYIGIHTYAAPGDYMLSMTDPNRNADVINISNPADVPFYIETRLIILDPQVFGFNNTPVLLQPPIDFANRLDTFYHNPNAYDPDGDSLTFELVVPKQGPGQNVPGYRYPDQVSPGANNQLFLDKFTGEMIWATPQQVGEYNVAILIKEYRNGFLIGEVLRDMQIRVLDEPNDPPQITELQDTCVIAGSDISFTVTATDPDLTQNVTLTASGGPLQLTDSPAQFPQPVTGQGTVSSVFSWQTNCSHISGNPYTVVFKAEDDYTNSAGDKLPLSDLETWSIRVVAPPPENLQAQAEGQSIILNWDSVYACAGASAFKGFSVWRKEGCDTSATDSCTTGAPPGYQLIAQGLQNYSFTDNNVERGKVYSYYVTADFGSAPPFLPPSIQSLPSNAACAELRIDVPFPMNVSVLQTSTDSGVIFLRWRNPNPDTTGLDTTQNLPPYRYELYRAAGSFNNNPVLIKTTTSNTFAGLTDTTFFDSLLNTQDNQYFYTIDFYSNDNFIGSSQASSIFLTTAPSDNQITLSWNEDVPWDNYEYHIFRRAYFQTSFDSIATTTAQTYTDMGLVNDSTYCYFVRSEGRYFSSFIQDTLNNLSQIACDEPVDTIPPCPPPLAVTNNCEDMPDQEWNTATFQNILTWQSPNDICTDDVVGYKILYAPTSSAPMDTIMRFDDPAALNFTHDNLLSLAGCYGVVAIDSFGNESDINKTCVENCPLYELPNAFTPNGDGNNDLFRPRMERFVSHVDFKVYNRWGELVFETEDKEINWNGTDMTSGKALPSGTYFYTCEVFVISLEGVKKAEEPLSPIKSYVEILR